jgi:UDP-N-acetylmuramoylalanine--D-glutamate ligase
VNSFSGKTVLVCGAARSGLASARLLKRLGARVTVQDLKDEASLADEVKILNEMDVPCIFGRNPHEKEAPAYDLLVLSPGVPSDLPFVEEARKLGKPVWGEIELAYVCCRAPVIAITGTNGKTTTTALVGAIVKKKYPGAETVGNIGVPFADKVCGLTETDYAVAEISSFQLETAVTFKPYIAAILNITPDHLNRHKTFENYAAVKEHIFKNQGPEEFAVLNFDDPFCVKAAGRISSRVVFFSGSQVLREGVYRQGDGLYVAMPGSDPEKIIDTGELQIFGRHNIENALAAIACGLCAGVPSDLARDALREFTGVEHRIEFVMELNGIKYYNDSKATNTDAAIKSVQAIEQPIILIAGGSDKGADFGGWVKTFQGRVKRIIVLGEVADKIIDTCKAYNFYAFDRVKSMKDAVALAYREAERGDCVLLSPACASFDMFDNYEQRGRIFKQLVAELGE